MRLKWRGAIVIAAVAGAIAVASLFVPGGDAPAPQVAFVTVKGETITTAGLRDKVVLVNFWATDCAVCVKEMPDLASIYLHYRARGFETVAVAMRHDPPSHVVSFVERNKLPFPVAFDPVGDHARAFGDVRLTPTTFVIDRRGRIVARIQGEPDFSQLRRLIERKLDEAA